MPFETFFRKVESQGHTGRSHKLACPGHNSYIYAWISKLFYIVVFLEEEKCHLKQFFCSPGQSPGRAFVLQRLRR